MLQKVPGSSPGLSQLETGKICQPRSKWVPFSNQGRIRQ